MHSQILLCTFFSLLASIGFCQSYVVTVKGDTIYHSSEYGKPEINYSHTVSSMGSIDYVEIREGFPKKSYNAMQAKTVYIEGDTYHSIYHEEDESFRFMKLLQDGYVRIYGYRIERQMEYNGRLLAKADGSTFDVPNLQFRRGLQRFFKDCEDVVAKLKLKAWNVKQLNEIVDEYNACIQAKTDARFRGEDVAQDNSQQILLLNSLEEKVKSLSDFPEKADALELLGDIRAKVENYKKIANYQLDALKGYLSQQKEAEEDLDSLLKVLR
ncbi:MAG: hypothetical protein RIB47_09195 [Cyclobacteriaceae bacterium]